MTDDWKLKWEPMVGAVGTDFAGDEQWLGADAAELGLIRRYCEPVELDCPLHFDAAVAQAHGLEDVIAPYSSLLTFQVPAMWRPGEEPLFTSAERDAQPARTPLRNAKTPFEPDTAGYFATGLDIDCVQPIMRNARLTRRGNTLVSCVPKETKVGRGAFTKWESEFLDESGAVVARLRLGRFSYDPVKPPAPAAAPAPATSAGSGSGTDAAATAPARSATAPAAAAPFRRIDWAQQRRWDDVRVGDELDPVSFPLSVYRLVVAAGANRDFNSIHHNSEYARATGATEMYANTTFLLAMWERTVREYIGLDGTIHNIVGFGMNRFNYVGTTVTVRGTVEDVQPDPDNSTRGIVRIRLTSDDGSGVTVGPGAMIVSLPRADNEGA